MSQWLLPNCENAPFHIFCFPFAGGGASAYRDWFSRHPWVAAIQPPGRENRFREPFYTSLTDMAADIAQELLPWLNSPYAFFGHSLGARVAFETILAARRLGASEPCHFFVSASPDPRHKESRPLHQLPDREFIRELDRFAGTPRELLENDELMAFFLPILRADFTVDETYEYHAEEELNCPVTAFCGSEDHEATPVQMEMWRYYTTGPFAMHVLEGGHFYLNLPENRLFQRILELLPSQAHPGLALTAASCGHLEHDLI